MMLTYGHFRVDGKRRRGLVPEQMHVKYISAYFRVAMREAQWRANQ